MDGHRVTAQILTQPSPSTMISVIVTRLQPHTFFFPNCTVLSKHILQRCYRKNMYYQQTINVSLIFITFHYILYSNHITLVMVHISSNDSLYHFTNFTSQKPPKIHRFGASKFSPGWTIILSPRIQRIQGFLAIKMGNITTHDTENDNFDIY